jgi:hypothetical protein
MLVGPTVSDDVFAAIATLFIVGGFIYKWSSWCSCRRSRGSVSIKPSNPTPRRKPVKIIGLHGQAGAGKDTAANFLYSLDREKTIILSLATPLKEICAYIFDLTGDQVYGSEKEVVDERYQKSPRKILEFVGTELFRRQIHPDIWLHLLIRNITKIQKEGKMEWIIVSDVRFDNEADAIRALGGTIMCISRNVDIHTRPETTLDRNRGIVHETEQGIFRRAPDLMVPNNSTFLELYQCLLAFRTVVEDRSRGRTRKRAASVLSDTMKVAGQ